MWRHMRYRAHKQVNASAPVARTGIPVRGIHTSRLRRVPRRPPSRTALSFVHEHGRLGLLGSKRPVVTLVAISQQSLAKACGLSGLSSASRVTNFSARLPYKSYAPATDAWNAIGAFVSDSVAVLSRSVALVSRTTYLTLLISPLALTGPILHVLDRFVDSEATLAGRTLHALLNTWWDYFRWTVTASGPTFIKLAQWAAARPDLFPEALCSRLADVHELVQVHDWSHTEATLDKALGDGWRDFIEVSPKPIGSGCIATVYRGKLLERPSPPPPKWRQWLRWLQGRRKPDPLAKGADVAIKVVHPHVRQEVLDDLLLLGAMASMLKPLHFLSFLSPKELVDTFASCMLAQLDLRHEAHNLQRFRVNFSKEKSLRNKVHFPEPIMPFVAEEVLVESFVHGRPVKDFLQSDLETREEISRLGVQSIMKMIFLDNFLHMDLHPGNVMVCSRSNARGKDDVTLAFLDAGMVTELSPKDHEHLAGILGAMFNYDGQLAGKLMVDNTVTNNSLKDNYAQPDLGRFLKGVQVICEDARDHGDQFMDRMSEYLGRMSTLACSCQVKLNAAFLSVALSMKLMEGFHVALHASNNLQELGRPILIKASVLRDN
uniref:ABC1 atypical kinase-like domain-containing protein n=1 Tax=Chrysotila carterae TaxID=13221 RepID=A0A7S4B881_CHRCT|mmetsp:Transcript_15234/g.32551  ORF Transcript_15234/g.32551 Transcript_15234/m.32551 type:complete len:603 (+) Transcript_15234:452-2260(+)